MAGVNYIQLDGKAYGIKIATLKRGLTSNYVPRVNYSGADTEQDLAPPFSRWVQDDWTGGFNLRRALRTGTTGYWTGYGIDPTRANELRRDNSAIEAGPLTGTGWRLQRWRGTLFAYSATNGTIYSSTGAGFTAFQNTGKTGIASMVVANAVVYFGSASDGQVFKWDGTTWSNFGTTITACPNGVFGLTFPAGTADGTVYAIGNNASTTRFVIGTWTGTSDQTGWSQKVIADGTATFAITRGKGMEVLSKYTANGNQGFHWTYDGTNFTNPGWWPDNFPAVCRDYGGTLYIGMQFQGSVWSWSGTAYTEVLHLDEPARPYTTPIDSMDRQGRWLAIAYNNPDDGAGLLYYDGTRFWPGPTTGQTSHTLTPGCTLFNGVVWWATSDGTNTIVWNLTSSFRTSARYTSALIDAELSATKKGWARVSVGFDALSTAESITIEAAYDRSNSWTPLGTFVGDGATTAQTFTFPATTSTRGLQVRATLAGPANSTGAAIRSITVDYEPNPDMRERFSVSLLLQDQPDFEDGTTDTRTSLQQYQDILSLRRAKKRFVMQWPDGATAALVTWPDHSTVGMMGVPTGGGWTAAWLGGAGDDDNGRYEIPIELIEVDQALPGSHSRLMLRTHAQLMTFTHAQLEVI